MVIGILILELSEGNVKYAEAACYCLTTAQRASGIDNFNKLLLVINRQKVNKFTTVCEIHHLVLLSVRIVALYSRAFHVSLLLVAIRKPPQPPVPPALTLGTFILFDI